MKPTLLILAAGMGSRYGGLKQIDRLGPSGETITDYSIYDAIKAGFGKVVVVIRRDIEKDFRDFFNKFSNNIEVDYVFQELTDIPAEFTVPDGRTKPWGTSHAMLAARNTIKEPFAVINADDFYGFESYHLVAKHLSGLSPESTAYCMAGYPLKNTLSEHGSVSRGICEKDNSGFLTSVVERTSISISNGNIFYEDETGNAIKLSGNEPVSMNFWGFAPSVFSFIEKGFHEFLKSNIDNPKSEYYIPTAINGMITEGQASIKVYETPAQWFGITYKEDKDGVVQKLNELVNQGKYPKNLWAK
jgi:NDP-sugar pyrophosphorylase family protein